MRNVFFLSKGFLAAALLTGFSDSCFAQAQPAAEKWVPLFNGKDLTGWTPKFKGSPAGENYKNTFRVEDGVLKVSYGEYEKFNGEFGHLFWKEKLTNYNLRVEYRFTGNQVASGPGWAFRNNGVMIHCQSVESMEVNQDFPTSLEVQLLGGTGTPRSTGNLCTPGTHVVIDGKLVTTHVINSKSKTYDGDQWVTVEIQVRGDKIRHLVEGEEVMSYSEPQLDSGDRYARKLLEGGADKMLKSGYISLQAETHPTEFRKIELLKVD